MRIRDALTWGIILVNIPTLLIALVLPVIIYYFLIAQDISLWYMILVTISSLCLGQLWWRIAIVKWKIWVYPKVGNLLELHSRAQKMQLIHDRQELQYWEIITPRDREVLNTLNLELTQALETKILNQPVHYYYSRMKLIASIFIIHLIAILGISILIQTNYTDPYFWLGILILGLYLLMYFFRLPLLGNPILLTSFQQLFSQKPQLSLSADGINILYKNIGFLPWKKIKNFQLTNTKAKIELLLFVQSTEQEYQKLLVPLDAYALDINVLERILSHYT